MGIGSRASAARPVKCFDEDIHSEISTQDRTHAATRRTETRKTQKPNRTLGRSQDAALTETHMSPRQHSLIHAHARSEVGQDQPIRSVPPIKIAPRNQPKRWGHACVLSSHLDVHSWTVGVHRTCACTCTCACREKLFGWSPTVNQSPIACIAR